MKDQKDSKTKQEEDVLRETIQKLGEVFTEFKSSYEGKIVKNGSLNSNSPEDLSEDDLKTLKEATEKLEKQLKQIKI
jgi:polyhydroxyalkanoate synthesis regulator phasin